MLWYIHFPFKVILKASFDKMPDLVDKDRFLLSFVEENIYVH